MELRKKTLSGQLPQTLGMAMLHGNLAAALAACGEFSQADENYQAAIVIQRSLAASSSLVSSINAKRTSPKVSMD